VLVARQSTTPDRDPAGTVVIPIVTVAKNRKGLFPSDAVTLSIQREKR
jgi:hypothetical protein